MELLFSEIGEPVEKAIWAGKTRVWLSMLRCLLDSQVEMLGCPLWLEDSRWRKGVEGKVSGGGDKSRPVVKLEQCLFAQDCGSDS